MAKATKSVHPKCESLNRRRVLTGAVTAAATVAGAMVSPSASAAALAARPSDLGLAFIAAVKEYNTFFVQTNGDYTSDESAAVCDRLVSKLDPLRERIEAQPITLSSLVDRAIVAAYDSSEGIDWTNQPGIALLVNAICGLGGVDPADAQL